jgi:DNA-directed RNA polymerase subunit beta
MVTKLTRIFSSPVEIGHKVDATLAAGLASQFPVEGKNFRLEVHNVRAERKDYTHEDEKAAILQSKSLTYPIRADLKLVDKATGKVVDEQKDFALMDSFHLTGKHTLLYKGNNYGVSNQLQLRPGVYTRFRDTGELESHFNTGTGRSFSLTLDPQSRMFFLEVGSSRIPAAPLISKVFGITPKEVASYVPPDVWEENLAAVAGKEGKIIGDFYKRLVSTAKQVPGAETDHMITQLRESLSNSKLDAQTTTYTLGKPLEGVTHEALLRALKNLVDVHRGTRQEDNRDSLQFKRVQNLPDFLRTRFEKEHQVVKLIKSRMARELDRLDPNNPKLRGNMVPKPFNKFFSGYIVDSQLVATPSETNPVESVESVAKVTVLGAGEGGIGEERGVPMGARDIDPSHLGIIDPSRTPESGHAGIDQRFTISAHRDDAGNLYARVIGRDGKYMYASVHEMMTHTVGFPNQDKKPGTKVQAQIRGELGQCDAKDVDFWLADATDMYTITTNLVPFLNSNHPGRLTMAGKAIPQALSLVNREQPLVQTTDEDGKPFVERIASIVSTSSPVHGTITKASGSSVTITPTGGGKPIQIDSVKNLPFNMKGFHDDETLLVKPGDTVKPGQVLYDSNYTRGGVLSLGRNLNVAYLPWKGYNHEDGLVLSKSAASKLSSHHAYKVDYEISNISVTKKVLVPRYFPGQYTREQLDKLDDRGFVKVGATLKKGDPVFAVLEHREPTAEDKMLGRMHKSLVTPYRLASEEWTHDENGTVVDAHTDSKSVRFLIRSVKPLEVGDKLTGLHGNKGIVSLVMDDHEMPYSEATGKPMDILLNPASVTSRVNLGQLMETVAGKIAKVKGEPYKIHNFSKDNNIVNLKKELESLGHSDSERLIDPKTKKPIGDKVLTGPQYFIKLYKTSDQNWSARNVGGYDSNGQPSKGGEEGSKSVGYMEMLGLLGSNARHNLREIATTKSENSPEYWERFLRGEALPKPSTTFATDKFLNYLTAAGIKTTLKGGTLTAAPLTDREILGMSNGEIKDASLFSAKNLEPEKGGLFDPAITGGMRGTKWSHYRLPEPIINPLMEKPTKSILGLSTKEFEGIATGKIGVKKTSTGFSLHDVDTGTKIRHVDVNSLASRPVSEPEVEEVEKDD